MNDLLIKIRLTRIALRIPQSELAHHLGTEQSTYSRIERGLTPLSVDYLFEIARAFKLPPEKLIQLSVAELLSEVATT